MFEVGDIVTGRKGSTCFPDHTFEITKTYVDCDNTNRMDGVLIATEDETQKYKIGETSHLTNDDTMYKLKTNKQIKFSGAFN